ncbi:MAG: methyltransferase [Pseudomonadota bacterium]
MADGAAGGAAGGAGGVGGILPAMPAPKPGGFLARLSDRYAAWRNSVVRSPAFQRHCARNPLLRPIANREARALFDLTAGFVYSQVLLAMLRLGLLEALEDGPASTAVLADGAGLGAEPTARLLEGAAALGLIEPAAAGPEGEARWRLAMSGAALLANPGVVAMIRHHDMLYRDVAEPEALLRGETDPEIGRFWAYARDPGGQAGLSQRLPAEAVGAYSELMAASQAFIAEDVLDRLPLHRYRRLLDIGGGEGAFLMAAAARAPALELRLFDLPAVAARAQARFEAAGLGTRAAAYGGDFFADPLPEGADAVSLVRVLYDHDDAFALAILGRARAALPSGGTLILAEPMAGLAGAGRVGAYFSFYLMAMGSGRARRPEELIALAEAAGFRDLRRHRTARPMLTGLITGRA